MISGLHSCRAGNEPQVGQVKSFVVQQMTGKSGKPYTKIKSANAENGGTPYKILSAKPTGHTDSYGNISFNLEIEPANGTPSATARLSTPPAQPSPTSRTASNGNWDDRSNRIERQHSQEMAIRFCALMNFGERWTPAEANEKLRHIIDWFQRDVGRMPSEVSKPEPHPEPDQSPEEDPF